MGEDNSFKILLIGSTGFIGSVVYNELVKIYGEQAIYKLLRNSVECLSENHVTLDIISNLNFNVVINCSGVYTNDFSLAKRVNFEFVQSVFNQINLSPNLFFVHISSYGIYNGNLLDKINEETQPIPVNNYELSKFWAQDYVLKMACKKCIIIPTNVYSGLNRKKKAIKFLKFIGYSFNTIEVSQLANEISKIIIERESAPLMRFINNCEEKERLKFKKLKKFTHKIIIKHFKSLLPHFLQFFEYREFDFKPIK